MYTGWPKKVYSSLIQYNLKIKRAITLKQEAFSSVMSNLNLLMCRVYFNTCMQFRPRYLGLKISKHFQNCRKLSKTDLLN